MARNARTAKVESETEEISDSIKENKKLIYTPISTDKLISTGSTLLDLAFSGGRVRGGGLPGGIMVEISGPSSAGKCVCGETKVFGDSKIGKISGLKTRNKGNYEKKL